jgi:hypothetical protein
VPGHELKRVTANTRLRSQPYRVWLRALRLFTTSTTSNYEAQTRDRKYAPEVAAAPCVVTTRASTLVLAFAATGAADAAFRFACGVLLEGRWFGVVGFVLFVLFFIVLFFIVFFFVVF